MYNGIGLQTARGSGTNGYIQSNKFFVRPKSGKVAFDGKGYDAGQGTAGISKKPNKDILEHDRKRQIELKLLVLEENLLDQGFTDTEIAEKLAEKRSELEAAAAKEEDGSTPTSNKFSDTQTHQIAALKERQMEKMRVALGIPIDEPADNQKEDGEVSDTEDFNDGELRDDEKKRLTDEKDDLRKAVKSRKNRESKDAREVYSSDTDSGARPARESRKKYQKSSRIDSESDVDADVRKTRNKSKKKVKRHDSHDSDSDANHEKYDKTRKSRSNRSSDEEEDKRTRKGHDKKGRRHDTGKTYKMPDSDSEASDSDSKDVKYDKSRKRTDKKSKRYDGESSQSDDEKDKRTHKRHDKKGRRHDSDDDSIVEKHERSYKRHDSDSEASDSGMKDGKSDKSRGRLGKKSKRYDSESSQSDEEKYDKAHKVHGKKGTRHDSDDSHSEGEQDKRTYKKHDTHGEENKRKQVEVTRSQVNQKMDKEVVRRQIEKHEKSGRKYNEESDSDRDIPKKGSVVEKSRGHYDIDSNLHDEKTKRAQLSEKHIIVKVDRGRKSDGSHKSDSDSDPDDHKRGKRDSSKTSEMSRGRHGGDATLRGRQNDRGSDLEGRGLKPAAGGKDRRKENNDLQKADDTLGKPEELYRSRGDTTGHSGHDSQEILRGKRKGDDRNQDEHPVSKSRSRHVGQETDHGGEYSKDLGKDSKSVRMPDDRQREDYSKVNRSRGRENDAIEHGGRTRSKEDLHLESRSNRDHEEQRGSRRYIRDDDENREKKHKRVEEDTQRRDGKDEEPNGSRRRGRNEEEERGAGRNERTGIKDRADDENRVKKRRIGEDVRGGDDKDEHRGSRRRERSEEEERGTVRNENTDIKDRPDDENREKKRRIDEEDVRGRVDIEEHHGNRRRGRDEEEERGAGRNERGGRHGDSSKRGKYEDSRSGEGRRYDIDREDGGARSRRRD